MRYFSVRQTILGLGASLGLAAVIAPSSWAGVPTTNGGATAATIAPSPAPAVVPARTALTTAQQENDFGWSNVATTLRSQFVQDQATLGHVTLALNQASSPLGGRMLERYSRQVRMVRQHVSDALTQIQSYESSINSLLQVLGPKAEAGEEPSITLQRSAARKTSLEIASLLVRVRVCDLQTRQLEGRLDGLRRRAQQVALVRHVQSPLGLGFWRVVLSERNGDVAALHEGFSLREAVKIMAGTLLVVLMVFLLGWVLRKIVATFLASTLARARWGEAICSQKALGALCAGVLCAFLAEGLWQVWQMSPSLGGSDEPSLLDVYLAQALPVFGFIVGAGVSLWRWLRGVTCQRSSLLLGWGILFYGGLRTMEVGSAVGPGLDAVLEGFFALSCAGFLYVTCRSYKMRKKTATAGDGADDAPIFPQDMGSLLLQYLPVYGASVFLMLVSIIAVLAGYMSFAFLLNGWALIVIYAIGVTLLLMQAWRDFAQWCFASQSRLGRLWLELGLNARRLAQMEVVSTALIGLALVMVFIALLQGTDGVSFSGAWLRLQHIFIGGVFYGVPLSPRTVVSGALLLVGVFYIIRFLQQWLQNRLFPVTSLDKGAQTSILSIMTYTLWIAAGLKLLALIGISVQNLTWVVSALSVGVGFGLQSIVKDFISGLILLAERPAQAGDKITISGNTGVVQRVNVRATDIRLGDGTTLIVPNSLFITANVQNYSAGYNPLKMSLVFSVPSDANLDKVQALFMVAVADQPDILRDPAPQSTLGAKIGSTIDVTLAVYTARGTNSDTVRTALLGAILTRFHAEGITLILPANALSS